MEPQTHVKLKVSTWKVPCYSLCRGEYTCRIEGADLSLRAASQEMHHHPAIALAM